MATANQFVVQETTAPFKRTLVQVGTVENIESIQQYEIIYEELTTSEKATYDAFVNLMNSKIPSA